MLTECRRLTVLLGLLTIYTIRLSAAQVGEKHTPDISGTESKKNPAVVDGKREPKPAAPTDHLKHSDPQPKAPAQPTVLAQPKAPTPNPANSLLGNMADLLNVLATDFKKDFDFKVKDYPNQVTSSKVVSAIDVFVSNYDFCRSLDVLDKANVELRKQSEAINFGESKRIRITVQPGGVGTSVVTSEVITDLNRDLYASPSVKNWEVDVLGTKGTPDLRIPPLTKEDLQNMYERLDPETKKKIDLLKEKVDKDRAAQGLPPTGPLLEKKLVVSPAPPAPTPSPSPTPKHGGSKVDPISKDK